MGKEKVPKAVPLKRSVPCKRLCPLSTAHNSTVCPGLRSEPCNGKLPNAPVSSTSMWLKVGRCLPEQCCGRASPDLSPAAGELPGAQEHESESGIRGVDVRSYGCGSKIGTENGTLVSGTKD